MRAAPWPLFLAALTALPLFGCSESPTPSLTGYLEAQRHYIGANTGGRVEELSVREGTQVNAGEPLFRLADRREQAEVEEARARVDEARARLEDARTQTQRPQEIAVLEAARADAEAAVERARTEYRRISRLHERGAVSESAMDDARTELARRQAALSEAERRIDAARLPEREFRIRAAEAALTQAQAALRRARTALDDTRVLAPTAGTVQEVLHRPGEVVSTGEPVIALLPPDSIKVRTFVPEARLSTLSTGTRIGVDCDGCPAGLTATVTFIADEAEFMPPNLLARGQRQRLAFLVEARPVDSLGQLPAGLPVTVHLPERPR